MVQSLDSADLDQTQQAWAAEAQKRLADIRSGRVQALRGTDVLAEALHLINR